MTGEKLDKKDSVGDAKKRTEKKNRLMNILLTFLLKPVYIIFYTTANYCLNPWCRKGDVQVRDSSA